MKVPASARTGRTGLLEIFLIYLRLGCLSFGGPVAHIGYFKTTFVTQLQWLSEARFAELMALSQAVPGPSSSQLGFAIGWVRGGGLGALVAWLGFTLPSACLMIAAAYGLIAMGEAAAPILDGLRVAAAAVVAHAVITLGKHLCPDRSRRSLALTSAGAAILWPSGLTQLGLICCGAIIGYARYRSQPGTAASPSTALSIDGRGTRPALLAFAGLMLLALTMTPEMPGALYAMHYQAGALVFGGGHVVLPLLQDTVVGSGLVAERDFLAGYGAAQALPGPLFTFAAFTGTIATQHWLGGLVTLCALFLPGLLLITALLPCWDRFRNQLWAQAGLKGANAVVVGLLLAALLTLVGPHSFQHWTDGLLVAGAYIALTRFNWSAAWVVLACGTLGTFL
jgi:chromate transporter